MLRGVIVALAFGAPAPVIPPLPNPMPAVVAADCPGIGAFPCYVRGTVFMWPLQFDRRSRREVLLHELGHAYDHQYLDAGERHRFTRLIGLDGPWRLPPNPVEETGAPGHYDSPEEWFANYYRDCRLRRESRGICGFIVRAGPRSLRSRPSSP